MYYEKYVISQNKTGSLDLDNSYLVYFWGQNFNLSKSLEGIIVGLSKQPDWLASFSKPSNNLYKENTAKLNIVCQDG